MIEEINSQHIAVKYYKSYHSGSAKTLKSIQVTLASSLEKFNLRDLANLTMEDDLNLSSIGKTCIATSIWNKLNMLCIMG